MLKNENYVVIQGWMINELKLKNNDLLVYAIIYGFSQTENQVFNGTLQYLADWCSATKSGIVKNLHSLLDKGLIGKREKWYNNIKQVEYYTTKLYGGIQQSLMGIQQSCINNINYNLNKDNKKENNIKEKTFMKPTIEEVMNYCAERNNNVDAEQFYDFYETKGWLVGKNKMKDWKACVRTWERNSNNKTNSKLTKSVPTWYEEYESEQKEKGVDNKQETSDDNLIELEKFFNEQKK